MRLLRHLQHWLSGQGLLLQVVDFVPETHPSPQGSRYVSRGSIGRSHLGLS
jgi:hypothetical protein